jgi:hypothetical protein
VFLSMSSTTFLYLQFSFIFLNFFKKNFFRWNKKLENVSKFWKFFCRGNKFLDLHETCRLQIRQKIGFDLMWKNLKNFRAHPLVYPTKLFLSSSLHITAHSTIFTFTRYKRVTGHVINSYNQKFYQWVIVFLFCVCSPVKFQNLCI